MPETDGHVVCRPGTPKTRSAPTAPGLLSSRLAKASTASIMPRVVTGWGGRPPPPKRRSGALRKHSALWPRGSRSSLRCQQCSFRSRAVLCDSCMCCVGKCGRRSLDAPPANTDPSRFPKPAADKGPAARLSLPLVQAVLRGSRSRVCTHLIRRVPSSPRPALPARVNLQRRAHPPDRRFGRTCRRRISRRERGSTQRSGPPCKAPPAPQQFYSNVKAPPAFFHPGEGRRLRGATVPSAHKQRRQQRYRRPTGEEHN
jgi:hypothetical protein